MGKVDENGRYTVKLRMYDIRRALAEMEQGENQVYALCGFVRAMGEGDDSLNRLAQRDGLVKGVWSGSSQR